MPRKVNPKTVEATGKPRVPNFGNKDAQDFWDDVTSAYDGYFGEEDTPILVLACDAWAQYRRCYRDLKNNEDDPKLSALTIKWFDHAYKMLVALGRTPCQRKNLNIPATYATVGAVESRGSDDGD